MVRLGTSPDWSPGSYEHWREGEPLLVAQGLQRHLLEVAYLDRFVVGLLQRLDETGLYDRALVIVTADHGISFRPGGWKRHVTRENVADIGVVPLFVKYPGQKKGREDRRGAQTIDVLPTVADVLGIGLPWSVDGRSLRSSPVNRPVRVDGREAVVVASHDEVSAEVLRVARRNAAYFGTGADSLYRFGPRRDLLQREVATIPHGVAPDAVVRFVRASEFSNVRKSSGYVPAHVVGRLQWDPLRPRERLAIAVNGRIAAVTTPFRTGARTLFSTMIDEAVLRDGSNDLQVFVVRGAVRAPRLVLLGGTGPGREYSLAAGGRSVVLPAGTRAPVVSGRLQGHIESSTVEETTVRIRGWAADLQNGAPVDRVLLFAGGRLLFTSSTSVYRFDIRGVSSRKGLQRIGFVAELPLRDVRRGDVRVFAVRGPVVSELGWAGHGVDLAAIGARPS